MFRRICATVASSISYKQSSKTVFTAGAPCGDDTAGDADSDTTLVFCGTVEGGGTGGGTGGVTGGGCTAEGGGCTAAGDGGSKGDGNGGAAGGMS